MYTHICIYIYIYNINILHCVINIYLSVDINYEGVINEHTLIIHNKIYILKL